MLSTINNIGIIIRVNGIICLLLRVAFINDYNELSVINSNYLQKTIDLIERYVCKIDILPISIRTSYGCPFSCKFCKNTIHWNNYRLKSKKTIDL